MGRWGNFLYLPDYLPGCTRVHKREIVDSRMQIHMRMEDGCIVYKITPLQRVPWPPWGHHVLGFREVWVQCARVSIEHGAPECLAV